MPDPYAYPGTNVLINLPGYTDPALWKEAESRAIYVRYNEVREHPLDGAFDLAHLQAIHAYLVRDFYAWGGQLRVSDTGPGGAGLAHCRPQFIPAEAARIFATLSDDLEFLRDRDVDSFSEGLAWVWGEMTVLHPFRDVNTRSQFIFFNQLAHAAGWLIDWGQIGPYVFGYARTVAITSDERGIDALIRPALHPLSEVGRATGGVARVRSDVLHARAYAHSRKTRSRTAAGDLQASPTHQHNRGSRLAAARATTADTDRNSVGPRVPTWCF